MVFGGGNGNKKSIGAIIRIGQEILCLLYAGFLNVLVGVFYTYFVM